MTEIRFYHMERSDLHQCLPPLLTKALGGGRRVLIKAPPAQLKDLDEHLWTFNPNAFLPHGLAMEEYAAQQPICISADDENPNQADILILTCGLQHKNVKDFDLCCVMFDGNDAAATSAARAQWKDYKGQDLTLAYWQQTAQGWEKKEV